MKLYTKNALLFFVMACTAPCFSKRDKILIELTPTSEETAYGNISDAERAQRVERSEINDLLSRSSFAPPSDPSVNEFRLVGNQSYYPEGSIPLDRLVAEYAKPYTPDDVFSDEGRAQRAALSEILSDADMARLIDGRLVAEYAKPYTPDDVFSDAERAQRVERSEILSEADMARLIDKVERELDERASEIKDRELVSYILNNVL
jgi:hypothetical protein